jgi:mono/diheme cytochrome c family protein
LWPVLHSFLIDDFPELQPVWEFGGIGTANEFSGGRFTESIQFTGRLAEERLGGLFMVKVLRCALILAALIFSARALCSAQSSGEAIYKSKCLNCHGTTGLANSGIGKLMKVKPVNDPDVLKMSEKEMVAAVRNGMGKMQAYKDSLSEAEIKESVDYFRTFIK